MARSPVHPGGVESEGVQVADAAEAATEVKATAIDKVLCEEDNREVLILTAAAEEKSTEATWLVVDDMKEQLTEKATATSHSLSDEIRPFNEMGASRPHHLPKLTGLSKKVEELRRNLDDVSAFKAFIRFIAVIVVFLLNAGKFASTLGQRWKTAPSDQ